MFEAVTALEAPGEFDADEGEMAEAPLGEVFGADATDGAVVGDHGGECQVNVADDVNDGNGGPSQSIKKGTGARSQTGDGAIGEAPLMAQSAPAGAPDNSGAILTPPAPDTPRINGAAIFGVRPGSPVIYHMPVTGVRPMRYSAQGLPEGVTLDATAGNISGSTTKAGTYKVTLGASNAKGNAERAFRLVVGDTIALTPPMGWNSYNVWSDQINQERELAAAKALVTSGLIEHGWA